MCRQLRALPRLACRENVLGRPSNRVASSCLFAFVTFLPFYIHIFCVFLIF